MPDNLDSIVEPGQEAQQLATDSRSPRVRSGTPTDTGCSSICAANLR